MVENCAESATTDAPHTSTTASSTHVGPFAVNPIASAHAHDTTMASAALVVRPTRSLYAPAHHEPANPAAIAANAHSGASAAVPLRASTSERNTATQPHIAYSSHMWPK